LIDFRWAGAMPIREYVAVIVRHHRFRSLARADFLAADDQWNVDAFVCHRF
jgi:hypothetical protein